MDCLGCDGVGVEVWPGWRRPDRKLWICRSDIWRLDCDWTEVRPGLLKRGRLKWSSFPNMCPGVLTTAVELQVCCCLVSLCPAVRTVVGCGWRPCVWCVKWPDWWTVKRLTSITRTSWREAAQPLINSYGTVRANISLSWSHGLRVLDLIAEVEHLQIYGVMKWRTLQITS